MQHDLNQIEPAATSTLPLITSESHPIRVDFLPDHVERLPGRLGMTIAPGKCNVGMHALWQRDLQQDVLHLRQHYGVDLLITLLQAPELHQLQIADLFEQVQTYGMQTHWFPIRDFGTPASMSGLIELIQTVLSALHQTKTVVIHCKAGLGRTGLVTASCLVALGYSPIEAFAQVRLARPGSVETVEQEEYVMAFAEAWRQLGTGMRTAL
jgi:protein-tyrosine phosphatase